MMNQGDDFEASQRVPGFPAFVRCADGLVIDWWRPDRSGDPLIDFAVGVDHLRSALKVFAGVADRESIDFYKAFLMPGVARPFPSNALANVVMAMSVTENMECGFLAALANKAMIGRVPLEAAHQGWTEEDYHGRDWACACIELARETGAPEIIFTELVTAINQTFEDGAEAFIWTCCVAATAGALN